MIKITKTIQQQIENMTTDELRTRLAEYMMRDTSLLPPLKAVEVRLADNNRGCRYEVLLIDSEGNEFIVPFHDRYSRLIYIYALLHPKGFQRRRVAADNYRELCQLYSQLYFRDSAALLRTVETTDDERPGQFISQYVAQSRKAIRQASPLAKPFVFDLPQRHNGRLLIPFAANGGTVIIDSSLTTNPFNL